MDYFAKNLRHLRKERALGQAELCAQTGFKPTTWSGYEKGHSKPNFADLLKIISYFEVTASELLEVDLENVHLNEKSALKKNQKNVHLNVHPNVHLNDNDQFSPCENCRRKDEILQMKEALISVKDALIESLQAQIFLLGKEELTHIIDVKKGARTRADTVKSGTPSNV